MSIIENRKEVIYTSESGKKYKGVIVKRNELLESYMEYVIYIEEVDFTIFSPRNRLEIIQAD